MATTTYTKASEPLLILRGRPWGMPLAWRNPDQTPIILTGFGLSAGLKYALEATIVPPAIVRNDAAGTFDVSFSAGQTAAFPPGGGHMLSVLIVDTAGNHHEFDFPVEVKTP